MHMKHVHEFLKEVQKYENNNNNNNNKKHHCDLISLQFSRLIVLSGRHQKRYCFFYFFTSCAPNSQFQ